MSAKIEIVEPRIVRFYQENKNLDITAMNLILIDILTKLSKNMSSTISQTVNARILEVVTELNNNFGSLRSDLYMKLQETRNAYVDDFREILNSNTLSNNEKIHNFLDKSNEMLLVKTTSLFNDLLPKNQERNQAFIEGCIRSHCSLISEDTKRLLQLNDNKTNDEKIRDLMTNMESHMSQLFASLQNPLNSMIERQDEKLTNNVIALKESMKTQTALQKEMSDEINEFLGRYKNRSQFKGAVAETELYFMLQTLMPSAEIINVTAETAKCDFAVRRAGDLPEILFESKDYVATVPRPEVEKFERDIQVRRCHGVFVSQSSPIVYKKQYQVDIVNGNILVYVANVEYNVDKLRVAVDIIDHLHAALKTVEKSDDTILLTDVNEYLEEFQSFSERKERLLNLLRSNNKIVLEQLEELQMPKLRNFLATKGKVERDVKFTCPGCQKNWPKKSSLAAHMKACVAFSESSLSSAVADCVSSSALSVGDLDLKPDVVASKKGSKKSKNVVTLDI